jgi:PAS domain S-box-containing protein
MTVASQLRLASGVVIAALVAILAVALYVPAKLNESANQKYANAAIPSGALVHRLVQEMVEEKAAADGYVLTRDPERQQEYLSAQVEVSETLNDLEIYRAELPRLDALLRRATSQIVDLDILFEQQLLFANRGQRRAALALRPEVEAAYERFRATTDQMLRETERFVTDAVDAQDTTYRQLLFALAFLGTLTLALALALFLLVPRRVGQLYESEQRSRREAESRAEAARALEHVSDGVILTGTDGVIEFWNPGATNVTGIEERFAIGRPLQRLLPGWEQVAQRPDAAQSGGAAVLPLPQAGGSVRWVSVTSVDFGEGVVYAMRDVTEERALETMRSDFVTTASHELRTPLTSISGAARTLVRHDASLTPERREAFLSMIVTETDRLSRIVDQILLANRLEAGQIEVTSEECDALEIARSVVDAVALHAPAQIRLRVEGDDSLPPVDCDPDRLRQVLRNLVDNAVKYSPKGGEIRVRLRAADGAMLFAVHDEGIGFEASAAEKIFGRFYREDPELTRGIGGTGLGLYICKELVERMGGHIWAEGSPQRGASFYFELPLARQAVSAA